MQDAVKGGVVLVDEASLVGTRDMLRLIEIVREKNARIVLVGDKRKQNRSVSAEGTAAAAGEDAGWAAGVGSDGHHSSAGRLPQGGA